MNLRTMTQSDADFLLELKNYPETRMFAIISKEEIKKEDHYQWLTKNIMWFQVIEAMNRTRVGVVRVFGNEISIWIDRQYWGLGIATEVINRVSTKGMYAKIVDGNVGSLRAFVKAGFVPVGYNAMDKYYLLQK